MKTLGLTGTRKLTNIDQLGDRTRFYFYFNEYNRYVTGACVGFDALIGLWLYQVDPFAQHTVIVPANRSQVSDWYKQYPNIEVIEMGPETDYADRNQTIVDLSDELLFCAEDEENAGVSKRSGTWQTVRMARRNNIPVHGVILSTGEVV